MRASRVVSLSALTLALTVGGIGAAAADTVNSNTSATTSTGSTSSYTHSTDNSFTMGSVTTSSSGVTVNTTETGISPAGHAYYSTTSQFANAQGVGESSTYNSTASSSDRGMGFRHPGDEWFLHHDGVFGDELVNVL